MPIPKADRIGWCLLLFLAALGLAMAVTGIVHADAPTLADRVAHLVPGYGSKKVELVDAEEFGAAVDTACNHDRECAARLVTMGIVESALSLSVSRSEFSPHQGDAFTDKDGSIQHRAWGTFELHKNAHNAAVWGSADLLTQARSARAAQVGARAECKAFRGLDPDVGMWRVLSGRGCLYHYNGEEKRMQLLAKIRGRL